ncbi:unnamed protein product [Caenorhabditis brenneri]
MVHPKAGSYGAVAQNARKKQKEASTMGKIPQAKKAPPPTAAKKKIVSKSQEKPQTPEEIRQSNELILFGKLMGEGKDASLVPLDKMEKLLDQMVVDEKSGEQYSDEIEEEKAEAKKTDEEIKLHRKKKDQEIDRRPITDQKMLLKYKVDREDYKLQYAYVDERPVYLELYQKDTMTCFERYNHKGPDCSELTTVTVRLFQLANEILTRVDPQKADHLPEVYRMADDYRRTAPHTNMCVNPLQIVRGWALLMALAQRKTFNDLAAFMDYYLCRNRKTAHTTAEHTLLSLHYDAEVLFDGAVRLFTEMPRHLPNNEQERRGTSMYYGGKSRRAAVQHHSFATDSDGFYSCYRINEEMALSTHGALRYVVPENHAPNWRASIAIATGMECTFYWQTESDPQPIEADNFRFDGGKYGKSKCSGIVAKAKVWQSEGMYRLEGQQHGIYLFIIPEDPKNIDKDKSIDKSVFTKINNYWPESTKKVFLPKCTTSTPLSLYNHAKHAGLSRLFSSEKSELRQLSSSGFDASSSPQFTTLFDHYHKTIFEVCASKPNPMDYQRKFDELAPERAHQCVDETMAKNFGKFQIKEAALMPTLFTYYEDHLTHNPSVFSKVDDETKFADDQGVDLNLGRPFYYIMTRSLGNEPYFPICTGYFNNTVWVMKD